MNRMPAKHQIRTLGSNYAIASALAGETITTLPRLTGVKLRDGFDPTQRVAFGVGPEAHHLGRHPLSHLFRACIGYLQPQFAQAPPAPPSARRPHCQTVATALAGEPTAPGRRRGGAVRRKRERPCARSQSARSERSQISPR
jgi:hypothetical protein